MFAVLGLSAGWIYARHSRPKTGLALTLPDTSGDWSSSFSQTGPTSQPSVSKAIAANPTPPHASSTHTIAEIEKMIDDDDVCLYQTLQSADEAVIREAIQQRINGSNAPMAPLLFATEDQMMGFRENSIPPYLFYQGLFYADLLGGLSPPQVNYPEALRFFDRGMEAQSSNGAFSLYKAYVLYLEKSSLVLSKQLLMNTFDHDLYSTYTAATVSQLFAASGKNTTAFLATKVAFARSPTPKIPSLDFFKTVMADATPAEISKLVDWAIRINSNTGRLVIENVLSQKLVQYFWKLAGRGSEALPVLIGMPTPDPVMDQLGNSAPNSGPESLAKGATCNRKPIDAYSEKCKNEGCAW